ncbi:MAG: hypothetical protein ACI3V0_00740 [Faecousia sp.]
MKSRTSSCKATAFRKDLTRFWPVPVGYLLCLILLQFAMAENDLDYWYASSLTGAIALGGVINSCYALAVVQALFGDLFSARLCNGIHSLPLRREAWFGAHITAGILFSLLPTAIMALFSEGVILTYSTVVNGWQIPLYWFAATNLQFVFFFGLGVFCTMLAGSRVSMTVLYGILNAFSMLLFLLVRQVYTPLLFGVVVTSDIFDLLCPVLKIANCWFLDVERVPTGKTYLDEYGVSQKEYIGQFTFLPQDWLYIGILAVLGIALVLIARRLYRKRNLECAGDFVAVPWLAPVFQTVFSLLCAAGFYAFFYLFLGIYSANITFPLLGMGLVAGWFVGRMFLERTTQVFRVKNFVGLALLAAVFAGSLLLTWLDPLGLQKWLPEADQVKSASLSFSYSQKYETENAEDIAQFIRLQQIAMEEHIPIETQGYRGETFETDRVYISLTYQLQNGRKVCREYYIHGEGPGRDIARDYGSRIEVVFRSPKVRNADDLRYQIQKIQTVFVDGIRVGDDKLTSEFKSQLAEALIADCEARTMVDSWNLHSEPLFPGEYDIETVRSMSVDLHFEEFSSYLSIYGDCKNTLSVLESTGMLDAVREKYANAYG